MDNLINGISNFFIQHPSAQVIASDVGKLLGCLLVLLMIACCIFLAFGKQKSFYYQTGSIAEICWKAGWLLQIIALADLSYNRFSGRKHISGLEFAFDCIPTVLLLFAQIYGMEYHKTAKAAKRIARQKLS